jgi:putative addiction module antidote
MRAQQYLLNGEPDIGQASKRGGERPTRRDGHGENTFTQAPAGSVEPDGTLFYISRKLRHVGMAKDEDAVVQIRRIGNSFGLILSEELLARLKLREGDKLEIVEQTEGGVKLSPYDPKHLRAMELARRSFRNYAETYKALAE